MGSQFLAGVHFKFCREQFEILNTDVTEVEVVGLVDVLSESCKVLQRRKVMAECTPVLYDPAEIDIEIFGTKIHLVLPI